MSHFVSERVRDVHGGDGVERRAGHDTRVVVMGNGLHDAVWKPPQRQQDVHEITTPRRVCHNTLAGQPLAPERSQPVEFALQFCHRTVPPHVFG